MMDFAVHCVPRRRRGLFFKSKAASFLENKELQGVVGKPFPRHTKIPGLKHAAPDTLFFSELRSTEWTPNKGFNYEMKHGVT